MPADLKSILNLEVPLIVVIAQRDMPVSEVMNLAPGAILELPKAADEDLEVMVNNRAIGAGRAVKVGENFGVRVTYVGDVQQRIEALEGLSALGGVGGGGGMNAGRRRPAARPASESLTNRAPPPVLATPV